MRKREDHSLPEMPWKAPVSRTSVPLSFNSFCAEGLGTQTRRTVKKLCLVFFKVIYQEGKVQKISINYTKPMRKISSEFVKDSGK